MRFTFVDFKIARKFWKALEHVKNDNLQFTSDNLRGKTYKHGTKFPKLQPVSHQFNYVTRKVVTIGWHCSLQSSLTSSEDFFSANIVYSTNYLCNFDSMFTYTVRKLAAHERKKLFLWEFQEISIHWHRSWQRRVYWTNFNAGEHSEEIETSSEVSKENESLVFELDPRYSQLHVYLSSLLFIHGHYTTPPSLIGWGKHDRNNASHYEKQPQTSSSSSSDARSNIERCNACK